MATSGSFDTGAYGSGDYHRYLRFEWGLISQSIANNTSRIWWRLVGAGGSGYTWVESGNFWVTINGVEVYGSGGRIQLWNGTEVASGEFTITHNSVGDGSFSAYAQAGIYYYAVNCSGDGWWDLPRIPRYGSSFQNLVTKTETSITMLWRSDSTVDYIWYSKNGGSSWTGIDVSDGRTGSYTISGLTANTTYNIKTRIRRRDSQLTTDSSTLAVTTYAYPNANSMPDFTIGDELTIGIANPLGRFITVELLTPEGDLVAAQATRDVTVTGFNSEDNQTTLYNAIPNAKSANYSVRVTYGEQVSTKTGGLFKINEANSLPEIGAISYRDANGASASVTENNQLIVQNQSLVAYTATSLEAKNGASIVACNVSVDGNSYALTLNSGADSASGGNYPINSIYDVQATVTAIDSRGLSASKTMTIKVLEWTLPTAIITLKRHNNFYTATDIRVDSSYSYVAGKNSVAIQYRYKKTGDSEWGDYEQLSNNVVGVFDADNDYAWDVQVLITDRFGTTTYNLSLTRGMPIVYYDILKSSVGFNCFPKAERSVEANGFNLLKSIITASLSESVDNLWANNYTEIQFDESSVIGSQLSVSQTGEIIIGSNVAKVKVSAIIDFSTVSSTATRKAAIFKNSYSADNLLCEATAGLVASTSGSVVIISQIISVSENDRLGLYYYSPDYTDVIGTNTALTVEVVG